MNKKDVAEIRKQFTPERCCLTRICGCYVTHEKEKRTEFAKTFLTLSEEECFKYFDIFKKSLSGGVGKNLFNMDFPLATEAEGGTQELLLQLRDSSLKDDDQLDAFYDKVIESYEYAENYYIVLVHGAYDIPGHSTDGLEMFDASDEVYNHILCCICPVNLSKAGLSYNAVDNIIAERTRDWIVELPMSAFLFPAYNDRGTDLHSVLYYSKKADDLKDDFIDHVLGTKMPLTAKDQKYSFDAVISDTLKDECDFDTVKAIHENLQDMLEETKDAPEPLSLTKTDVKKLLENSGVESEKLEDFDQEFEETIGDDSELLAENLTNTRTFELKTGEIKIKVPPIHSNQVQVKEVEGRQCIVIPIEDDLIVNGLDVTK